MGRGNPHVETKGEWGLYLDPQDMLDRPGFHSGFSQPLCGRVSVPHVMSSIRNGIVPCHSRSHVPCRP